MSYSHKKPSLFWPLLLITIGIVLLLSNFGLLPPGSINLLWRFWPLLLVIAGLDILLGRRSAPGAIITTVVTIALIVGAVVFTLAAFNSPEMLRQFGDTALKHETIQLPLDGITSAGVTIDLPAAPVEIYPLSDSNALIEGDINYFGSLIFDTNAIGSRATINLDTRSQQLWLSPGSADGVNPGWRVGLHPRVALDLTVDAGSGETDLDLRQLDVRTLNLDAGSGAVSLKLPATGHTTGMIDAGSGRIDIILPDGAGAKITIDRGSGSFDAGSRLYYQSDSGNAEVWLTKNFATAENTIELVIDAGSGTISVQ